MPFQEYEAMVFIENESAITEKFRNLNATLLNQAFQRDNYYDLNYKLAKKDELLRIRIEETIDAHEFLGAEFSWKSGRKGTQYEVREDISIQLPTKENILPLEEILSRLGFKKLAWLTKYRDRWRLNEVDFEFDKYIEAQVINRPNLKIGSYLQATIETETNYSSAEMETLLWTELQKLGFNRSEFHRTSYIELYLQKLKSPSENKPLE
ncbi:MAG: CYTH domain-containing protein [Candidatus Helarchaeota archaeon]|nr:CYTH domain-containing protein [Candidatus Helarchaeota archaeon]